MCLYLRYGKPARPAAGEVLAEVLTKRLATSVDNTEVWATNVGTIWWQHVLTKVLANELAHTSVGLLLVMHIDSSSGFECAMGSC